MERFWVDDVGFLGKTNRFWGLFKKYLSLSKSTKLQLFLGLVVLFPKCFLGGTCSSNSHIVRCSSCSACLESIETTV